MSYQNTQKAFLGIAVLLIWISVLQFLMSEKFRAIYAIVVTFQFGIPRILAFAAGFLPLYFAFVFLGICLFSDKLGSFNSFGNASVLMFTYMNGDSIKQILELVSIVS
jgi:hypothetical protein